MKIVKIILALSLSVTVFVTAGSPSLSAQSGEAVDPIQKALDSIEAEGGALSLDDNAQPQDPLSVPVSDGLRAPAPEEVTEQPAATTEEQPLAPPVVQPEETLQPSAQIQAATPSKIIAQPSAPSSAIPASAKALEPAKKSIMVDVLELKDMDINDVLKLISQKTNLNIVAGQNVRAKITIYLKKVDVRDALRIILESNDLAYSEEGGIIRVMTAKDYEMMYGHRFGEKTRVKIIQLKHANAADAVALSRRAAAGRADA